MTIASVHTLISGLIPRDPDVGFALLAGGLVVFAFWLGALQSCIANEPPTDHIRMTWTLLIVFLGPIGALGYFFIRRPQRIRDIGW